MSWGTLGDIKRENAQAVSPPRVGCPNCGNVLQRNKGILNCPTGDFRVGG